VIQETQSGYEDAEDEDSDRASESQSERPQDAEIEALHRKIQRLERDAEIAKLKQRTAELEAETRPHFVQPPLPQRAAVKKFVAHNVTFKGITVTEYTQWITALEGDHAYYHHYFATDEEKVFEGAHFLK
jgi:hypothetical protein